MTRLIFIQNTWRCDDNALLQLNDDAAKIETVIIGNVDAKFDQDVYGFPRRSPDFIRFNLASALEMSQTFLQQTGYRIPIFNQETDTLLQHLIQHLEITHCRIE